MATATRPLQQGRPRPSDPRYSGPYAALINQAGAANNIDPWLLASVLFTESRFDPNADNGQDRGIAEINRVAHPEVTDQQALNPSFAIPWAARDLANLRTRANGSITGALRAYNTGSTSVTPKGTAYVDQVLARYRDLRASIAAGARTVGAAVGSLGYPLGVKGPIVGRPYQGSHRDFGNWESDNAYDIGAKPGTPVYAVESGTIGPQIGPLGSSNPQLAGQRLHLVTGDNEFYYAHLQTIAVKAGQHVNAGDLLGTTGALNHLHIAQKKGWAPAALRKPPQSSGIITAGGIWGFLQHDPLTPWNVAKTQADIASKLIPGGVPGAGVVKNVAGFLDDPGYWFTWLLFMLLGFGLIYMGIIRLFPQAPRPGLPTVIPVPL